MSAPDFRIKEPIYGFGHSGACMSFSASEMAVPHRRRCTRPMGHRGPHSFEFDGKPYDRMQAAPR